MYRFILAGLISIASTSGFSSTLLTPSEQASMPHVDLSFGVTAILIADFEEFAEAPAIIVKNGSLKDGNYSIIQRNG